MKRLFVCEKCGHIVPRQASRCGFCGQPFDGIKCPACGFQGDAALFGEGCPACGFTGDSSESGTSSGQKLKSNRNFFEIGSTKKKKKMLPLVFYRIAGIVLILLIISLVVIIMRFYA